jgi:hypothetical protein
MNFILTSILFFGLSMAWAEQSPVDKRIHAIEAILKKNQSKEYLYKSRHFIDLMNEKECLDSIKSRVLKVSKSDCEKSMKDVSVGDIAKEIHYLEKIIQICKQEDCKEMNKLLHKRQKREATYRIKLVEFLSKKLRVNTQPIEIESDCLKGQQKLF